MADVFIDTDVILDLFLDREPHHREALRFFSHLKKNRIEARTSPIVFANTYHILSKLKTMKYATEKIGRLRNLIGIVSVSETTIDTALRSGMKDFEDSIQYYCAREAGIRFLVTRNTRDYPRDGMHILLPIEYRKLMAGESA